MLKHVNALKRERLTGSQLDRQSEELTKMLKVRQATGKWFLCVSLFTVVTQSMNLNHKTSAGTAMTTTATTTVLGLWSYIFFKTSESVSHSQVKIYWFDSKPFCHILTWKITLKLKSDLPYAKNHTPVKFE